MVEGGNSIELRFVDGQEIYGREWQLQGGREEVAEVLCLHDTAKDFVQRDKNEWDMIGSRDIGEYTRNLIGRTIVIIPDSVSETCGICSICLEDFRWSSSLWRLTHRLQRTPSRVTTRPHTP